VTVDITVDLGRRLRWGESKVRSLSPETDVFQFKTGSPSWLIFVFQEWIYNELQYFLHQSINQILTNPKVQRLATLPRLLITSRQSHPPTF